MLYKVSNCLNKIMKILFISTNSNIHSLPSLNICKLFYLFVEVKNILGLKMNYNRERNVSNSRRTPSASQLHLQMHNFMPMPSSSIHVDHDLVNRSLFIVFFIYSQIWCFYNFFRFPDSF